MRLFMNTLIVVTLMAILAGVVWHGRSDAASRALRETARLELRRFQQQIALQTVLAHGQSNERGGYPQTIEPSWFHGNLPSNGLLPPEHPWVEIASPQEKDLLHPLQRVAGARHIARFWYNPHLGVVRARVPVGLSDSASLEMYNFVNDAELPTLFADASVEPARQR